MKVISYAKNLEDIILWRALNHYGPGFYIDVGVSDPHKTATRIFYENNWRGINIDPTGKAIKSFLQHRSRDINLKLAIENDEAVHVANPNQKDSEQWHIDQANILTSVCQRYVQQEIYFLKIDMEGYEHLIVASSYFKKYRPWVVLINAIQPSTQISTYHLWENFLIQADYSFVYFDGLNRFYIAKEKLSMLSKAFMAPPNWFDFYVRHQEIILEQQLKESCSKVDALESELDFCYQLSYENSRQTGWSSAQRNNLLMQLRKMSEAQTQLEQTLSEVYLSTSWKITAPMRKLLSFTKKKLSIS